MKHIILSVAFAVLLAGCATTENYNKTLNTWLGAPVDDLITQWGPPDSESKLSDGGRVLEYFYSSKNLYYNQLLDSYQTLNYRCKTLIIVDANGIIANWRTAGNACKS